MRLALVSDIHGNLEAFEAVLRVIETEKVDHIHCLGDVIGYGCDPIACLDLVARYCDIKLMGNHEYAAIGVLPSESMNLAARKSTKWTAEQLTDRELAMIADFEMTAEACDCLLVHASPEEPGEWHYILSQREAARAFAQMKHKMAFHGHTHIPLIFSQGPNGRVRTIMGHDFDPNEDCLYLVNTGSVGQPRDSDPRASFIIYDADEHAVYYHRVGYDFRATQAKMLKAEMPPMLIDRLEVGR